MNLKDFLTNRESAPELYWSLVLEEGWVQAGVWSIGESAANVICQSPPTAWETENELVGAADAALSSAIQKLTDEYKEPDKTVFGVPSFWVEGGEISQEYLDKIKKICSQLSLTPVGFVVLPEAIAHLYKSTEGTPVSAVIVGLSKEYIEISVFKLGELVGSSKVARSVSLIDDVSEGLSRFEGSSPLPSRFIVFDGKGGELEEAKEELMKASWETYPKVKFLHTPKAEILTSDRKVVAVSLAGANEIAHVTAVTTPSAESEETPGEELGDVQNVSPVKDMNPQDLGFAIGEDVSLKRESENIPSPQEISAPASFEINPQEPEMQKKSPDILGYLNKTKSIFKKFSDKFRSTDSTNSLTGKHNYLPLAIGMFAIVIAGLLGWWFLPKANISIYVSPKGFQDSFDISLSLDGETDLGSGILPARTKSVDVSGNKTKSATGSKLVGDKAKGSVQIANGNSSALELAAGTTLFSSSGLKFLTNSEASVSGQLLPGSPGTSTVEVTAADIGDQYNLPKGEVYRVGNYSKSLVAATSTSDFSGGSSRQISAVSKDDQEKLYEQLEEELLESAKKQISEDLSDGVIFADDLSGTEIVSEAYDKKVGEEADSIKLSLELKAEGVLINKDKLFEYARNVLREKVPAGFVLRDSQIGFKFTFTDKAEGKINYKVAISANFLPEVNTEVIIKQISGRSVKVAQNYLNSVSGFSRAEIKLLPTLPGPLGTLPRVAKNISIEVLPDK